MSDLNLFKGMLAKLGRSVSAILKLLLLMFFALNITACSSDYLPSQKAIEEKFDIFGTQKVTCPTTRILRQGDSYLAVSEQPTTQQTKAIAKITTVRIACKLRYPTAEERTSLSKFAILRTDVQISILYLADTGEGQVTIPPLPYFVALANRFGEITTKEIFRVRPPSETEDLSGGKTVVENILVNIPIDDLDEAEGYEMLVGFQLSEQQMEHLRRSKYK